MFRKLPAAIVLACLLGGCASTMKPSALPAPTPVMAPEAKAKAPAALLTLPVPPEPLEPDYSQTH